MTDRSGSLHPAVVFNPIKVDQAALREAIATICRARGLAEPMWFATTEEDPGFGQTRIAVERGADLIIACGGDGTVAACASVLTGTGVALALIPSGTGNLLARNLNVPLALSAAVDVAFGSFRRTIDVLRSVAGRHFVVMAGLGFDAAMIEQTNDQTKARLGWPAYVGGIARALRRSPRATVLIGMDGATPVRYRAVGILVGNVGQLQAGLTLLPEASPTDGLLDVAVLAPSTWRDWPLILVRIATRRVARGGRTDVLRGSRVEITSDRPLPLEFDGELAGATRSLTVEVLAEALVVCVPT